MCLLICVTFTISKWWLSWLNTSNLTILSIEVSEIKKREGM